VTVVTVTLLSTTYTILSNILLLKLTPYVNEIMGDHQYSFIHKTSTSDQIFCIRHMLEKKLGV